MEIFFYQVVSSSAEPRTGGRAQLENGCGLLGLLSERLNLYVNISFNENLTISDVNF